MKMINMYARKWCSRSIIFLNRIWNRTKFSSTSKTNWTFILKL